MLDALSQHHFVEDLSAGLANEPILRSVSDPYSGGLLSGHARFVHLRAAGVDQWLDMAAVLVGSVEGGAGQIASLAACGIVVSRVFGRVFEGYIATASGDSNSAGMGTHAAEDVVVWVLVVAGVFLMAAAVVVVVKDLAWPRDLRALEAGRLRSIVSGAVCGVVEEGRKN